MVVHVHLNNCCILRDIDITYNVGTTCPRGPNLAHFTLRPAILRYKGVENRNAPNHLTLNT